MNLYLHLSIHLFFALLAGLIVWLFFRRNLFLALMGGLLGGFMVDFDHFIDYFLAFSWNFQLDWFVKGYEFLKLDQIHLFFHAWEYVIILIALGIFLASKKAKVFFFSLALGLFFHLSGDVIMNEGLQIRSYSMIYKIKSGFQIEKLVTPEHYQEDQKRRQIPRIKEIIESTP
ncbi:MAG: hypothetical protein ACOYS2_01110 [Patescibacteria group bacterium]